MVIHSGQRSLLTFLVLSPSLIRSGLCSVPRPVGLAARGEDLGVVPEAVEQRRCELFSPKTRTHSLKAKFVVTIVERRS